MSEGYLSPWFLVLPLAPPIVGLAVYLIMRARTKRRAREMVAVFDSLYAITEELGREEDRKAYNLLAEKFRKSDGRFKSTSKQALNSLIVQARLFIAERFGSESVSRVLGDTGVNRTLNPGKLSNEL